MLFVDSSHVSKMGSEVNHIVFDVLPALNQGVLVHFHDVFWPFEYPKDWLLVLGRAWNETYLLRAFLQYNDAFEIVLFTSYLAKRHTSAVEYLAPRLLEDGASSLWLRYRADRLAQRPPALAANNRGHFWRGSTIPRFRPPEIQISWYAAR